jgi:hypothetical protein
MHWAWWILIGSGIFTLLFVIFPMILSGIHSEQERKRGEVN